MAERRDEKNIGQTGNQNINQGGQQGRAGSQHGNIGGQGQQGQGGMSGQRGGQGQQDLTRVLENVNFPVTKQDLISRVGNEQINVQGRQVQAREVLNRMTKDRFTDRQEIERELNNLPEFRGSQGGQQSQTSGARMGGGRQ